MNAVDAKAAELAALGRPVMGVFFCSDTPETTFISAANLTATFPRPWKYLTVPPHELPRSSFDHKETTYYMWHHPYEQQALITE